MRTLQEGADSILNIYLRKNTKQTSQHTWAVVVAQAIEIQHFCWAGWVRIAGKTLAFLVQNCSQSCLAGRQDFSKLACNSANSSFFFPVSYHHQIYQL